MIERFSDSLKQASSRCRELVKSELVEKPSIFVDLVASLKVAAGSAHQLAMAQSNPNFLLFRDTLEKFAVFAQSSVFKDSESLIWFTVADKLDELAINGKKAATSKAMSRQDVLENLDTRQKTSETN